MALSDVLGKSIGEITGGINKFQARESRFQNRLQNAGSIYNQASTALSDLIPGFPGFPGAGQAQTLTGLALNRRGDALQNWGWTCLPPRIGNLELPFYYVQSINLPNRKIGSEAIQRNGHAVHYPDAYTVDDITMGLFMDTENRAMQWFQSWHAQVLGQADPRSPQNQGSWGLPGSYKKDFVTVLLSPSRNEVVTARYLQCWPTDSQALELVSATADHLVLNVTLKVEDVKIEISNDKGKIDIVSQILEGGIGSISGILNGKLNSLKNLGSLAQNFGSIGGIAKLVKF